MQSIPYEIHLSILLNAARKPQNIAKQNQACCADDIKSKNIGPEPTWAAA